MSDGEYWTLTWDLILDQDIRTLVDKIYTYMYINAVLYT